MIIRCSGLSRVMSCPGSKLMKDLPEDTGNEAAKEGTAAGELLEAMLAQRTVKPNVPAQASNGVYFNDEMYSYLAPCAERLLERQVDVRCEVRIDWQTTSGITIRGQYDMCYEIGDTLYVEDLKYGYGIVEVKENWQLLGYAIGEIYRQGRVFDKIVFRIFQPRPHHKDGVLREWSIDYNTLLKYHQMINEKISLLTSGEAYLETGPHCRYCPAAGERCQAFNNAFYNTVDVSLAEVNQDGLTDVEIASQLDVLKRAENILKIKKESLEQLGVARIRQGRLIPGYTVDQTYSKRYWKKHISPSVIETMTGIEVTETVLKSPHKCKQLGVPKELVESFSERFANKTTLKKQDTTELGNKIFNKGEE